MTADQALILIVDDDYDFLEINRIILEGAGYRVVTATEPARRCTRIAAEKPDLVITDLMMTSIDAGFAFAAQLKDDPRTAGVPDHHLHLGQQRPGPRLPAPTRPRTCAKMHVDAYFDKPLDAQALLAKVDELLAAPAADAPRAAPRR